jgi:hypothetical protein
LPWTNLEPRFSLTDIVSAPPILLHRPAISN